MSGPRDSTIAVIIPCFNMGRTLTETVESVRGQTRPPDSVTIVDDGSTDQQTLRVIETLATANIKLIRTSNRGPAAARNLGIRESQADYIVLLDADDALDPMYLECLSRVLDDTPDLAFVSCALRAFGDADYFWRPPPCTFVDTLVRGGVHISTMFRRQVWLAVGGFDEALPAYEDTDFWLSALECGFHGTILDAPLLRYRVHADSRYHRALRGQAYCAAKQAIMTKHRQALTRHAVDVIGAMHAFFAELVRHSAYLKGELRALGAEPPGHDATCSGLRMRSGSGCWWDDIDESS